MLEQRCREWGVPMFISTIDFTKAFDRIKHQSLWNALKYFGLDQKYIDLLKKLYADQKATVLTDKESDEFEIKRGTKQGDPLSSLLFNTVLQNALEDDLTKWQRNNKGIPSSEQKKDCLTNLRFANNVLLFSTSLSKLKDMLSDFKRSTESVDLEIHPNRKKFSVIKM